ncbi:MAG: hypothetical protein UY03_C0011G0044 [Parcubacteria group bacterium GW2011_GWA2_47_64]|nr:MAG: hypothetical protein UY03_C0011G0044 [Parcubacteria group bacterium GW2011_GWA2_47_64]KKU96958.1 MAG: hypothetical protein UY29_C0004G0012 [Parcubacteria group bacterium GW2011_GWC2_48_17]
MHIFEKGKFESLSNEFKQQGLLALQQLSEFQEKFSVYDTDTTINSIRDTIVASYLGFELINTEKHGFDAKRNRTGEFLEVKQCSLSAKRWGGTWNDTNIEKAKAFSDKRLFTAIAVWRGASDLQFIVFGQSEKLGEYLLKRVKNRKKGSRSTQNVGIEKLIEWGFSVLVPPGKSSKLLLEQLLVYNKRLSIRMEDIKTIG